MEIKVPSVGESIHEALLAKWLKKNGEQVQADEPVCEIETDKITVELNADASGVLTTLAAEGETVKIGQIIGRIDPSASVAVTQPVPEAPKPQPAAIPVVPPEPPPVQPGAVAPDLPMEPAVTGRSPSARRVVREGRPVTTRAEVSAVSAAPEPAGVEGRETRKPMSPIRRKIAERLVAARQQTAMLTTFNEADMSAIMAIRRRHKEHFRQKFGVPLGLMSFFVKASIEALKAFPEVNARIDGGDIVHQHFYNIGIAIGAEKGLVVPVLKDADRLDFPEIELAIAAFGEKVKTNRLELSDLEGGTFTISNGGVYGSMLSTPMLNLPQCAVLGMHAIQERPVVREGQIVARPMMYLALTYDHRLIDGRQAVEFLKHIKELVEEPEELLLET